MSNNKLSLSNVVQDGDTLRGRLDCTVNCAGDVETAEYINSVIGMRFKVESRVNCFVNTYITQYYYKIYLKVRFLHTFDDMKIDLSFSSNELGIKNKTFTDVDEALFLLHETNATHPNRNEYIFSFDIEIVTRVMESMTMFESLYDDTDLTDFELCGEGGSVRVHKAVLASCSPVLKTMFVGEWAEKSGTVTIPGVTKTTLEQFKAYFYLRKMPDSGLKELLLLASCYMIPVLEYKCIKAIVNSMTAENALDLCEFAVLNRMTKLHIAILAHLQKGTINIGDLINSAKI